jgi:hypothetical protein
MGEVGKFDTKERSIENLRAVGRHLRLCSSANVATSSADLLSCGIVNSEHYTYILWANYIQTDKSITNIP